MKIRTVLTGEVKNITQWAQNLKEPGEIAGRKNPRKGETLCQTFL